MSEITVAELIAELQKCPSDAVVNIMARSDIDNGDSLDIDIDNCACDGHNEITINVY